MGKTQQQWAVLPVRVKSEKGELEMPEKDEAKRWIEASKGYTKEKLEKTLEGVFAIMGATSTRDAPLHLTNASPKERPTTFFPVKKTNQVRGAAIRPTDDPAGFLGNYNDMLTIQECCVILRVTQPTMYKWIKQGRIKSIMLGRRRLIPKTAISKELEG